MKTESEITIELNLLKQFLSEETYLNLSKQEIQAKITALQWVLGTTSDIFND